MPLPLARRLVLVAALMASAAVSPDARPSDERVRSGAWGGDHIVLEVTDTGARVELDCAHGTITESPEADANGAFDWTGTFAKERPGPIREDEPGSGEPAHYSGRVRGSSMTLTIALTKAQTAVGTFSLTHGRTPRLTKCG